MTYQKKSSKKWLIAIILIVVLSVASAAALYITLSTVRVEVGVKVGDTFTYSIIGTSQLTAANATMTPGFAQYNQTDYYKITITAVNGEQVSMDTEWKFLNGTSIRNPQTINIGNGNKTDDNGFWAIYPANLNKGELLRPRGYDGQTVNNTDTYTYTSGPRGRCSWHINNQFYDINDQTYGTQMYDYRDIFFDRATGMMTYFANWQIYNNPSKTEVIYWNLKSTSVWEL